MSKHYNIPVFLPEINCPNRCIYCNQYKITGQTKHPEPNAIKPLVASYLNTFKPKKKTVELAFFGGTFTGMPKARQIAYLKEAKTLLDEGKIQGIRLSTRPDYVDQNTIDCLSFYGVTTVELGVQSMNDLVLKNSRRNYTSESVKRAAQLIKRGRIKLGIQIMTGLPGDNYQIFQQTVEEVISLQPTCARIYPTLVIKDTILEQLFLEGKYKPQTLAEAIRFAKNALWQCERANIKVIRVGLHPSEELCKDKSLVDGPFHPAFREMVLTDIWNDLLKNIISNKNDLKTESITIYVNPKDINHAIGYKGINKKMLLQHFFGVKYKLDPNIEKRKYELCYH